jgi:FkbM family methyltransferase
MHQLARLLRELFHIWSLGGPRVGSRYLLQITRTAPAIVRERSLAPADARMAGRWWRFRIGATSVRFDGRSFGLAREIYGRKSYLPPDLGFRIKKGDLVIDLGANTGIFTVLAALSGAEVIAVEAQAVEVEALRRTLAANECAGCVTVVTGVVGATSGLLNQWSAEQFRGHVPKRIEIEQLLASRSSRVDLLKIDIEGSEFDLCAEPRWLERVDRLAMEVHHLAGDVELLLEVLRRNGFDVRLRRSTRPDSSHVFAWRRAPPDSLASAV